MFCLSLVFFILALVYFTLQANKRVEQIETDLGNVKSQIALYREKVDRVTQIMKDLAVLEQKFEIINTLEVKRWEPVALMDAMTALVVPSRMWITSIKTEQTRVALTGIAFDNKAVADFMTRIEGSPFFSGVDLKNIKMQTIDKDIQMKAFELMCNKKVPDNPENMSAGEK